MRTDNFKRGDQIIYVPLHAHGDKHHADSESGFVTSVNDMFVFCRFWRKGHEGLELRTVANSEAVDPDDLLKHPSVAQPLVTGALERT